jgi:hypothetical protein
VNVNSVAEAISTALNCSSSTPHARQTALSFLHSVRNFSNSSSLYHILFYSITQLITLFINIVPAICCGNYMRYVLSGHDSH